MRDWERVGGMRIEALETGLPGLIRHAGTAASPRFLEFFTAVLRNLNTREAYARAAVRFCVSDGMKTDETCRFENH